METHASDMEQVLDEMDNYSVTSDEVFSDKVPVKVNYSVGIQNVHLFISHCRSQ